MKQIILVAGFGLSGVLLRYGISTFTSRQWPAHVPLATFSINIIGSFLIGLIYVLGVERLALNPDLRVALMSGFLGGFTTFSAFTLEGLHLMESGNLKLAALYLIGSPVLGLSSCYCGVFLARNQQAFL